MPEIFYMVCLAVGFGLGWYMKREKVPHETVERIRRMEEANRERRADMDAFVVSIAAIWEELDDLLEESATVVSGATGLWPNSRREDKLHDKINELEREIDRAAERWSIRLP